MSLPYFQTQYKSRQTRRNNPVPFENKDITKRRMIHLPRRRQRPLRENHHKPTTKKRLSSKINHTMRLHAKPPAVEYKRMRTSDSRTGKTMQPPITFIAPFESMAAQAEKIIAEHGYPANVSQGDLGAGVRAAASALENGAKVIISRGGTAELIQQELADRLVVDVIDVEASVYDIINYLHRNNKPDFRVAVVGFPQFIATGKAVCESMDIFHRIFEIANEADAVPVVNSLAEWHADAVVGDTISCRLMADLGWGSCHLIESSPYSIRDAFERAMLLLANLDRQLTQYKKLSTVLSCAVQGIGIIDENGVVEDINLGCRSLLGVEPDNAIGKSLSTIIPEVDTAALLGRREGQEEYVIDRKGEQLVIDFVPLSPESSEKSDGFVMTVQPARRIQEMENAIRTKLRHQGFLARKHLHDILHDSPAMKHTIAIAEEYAKSDANIIITGETGTGKELFAQGIHNASARSGAMFVAINCAALSPTLLESELFGYSPGAFTGALRSGKPGLFEMTHKGTLFLDEIGEMDPFLQTRLLRAIQEREIMRIGDNKVIPVDVRIIAAANKDLEKEVTLGNLRMDLFFRLNVLSLSLPPLRERKEDVVLLLKHYLAKHAERMGVALRMPGDDFFAGLAQYEWPGNVRELENLAERYVVLQNRPESGDFRGFLPSFSPPGARSTLPDGDGTLDGVIRHAITRTLEEEHGNIQRASRRLGVTRNTVKRWMREQKGEAE